MVETIGLKYGQARVNSPEKKDAGEDMQNKVEDTIKQIEPLDRSAMDAMQEHLDQLTKPPGSLGRLEEIAVQLAGITREIELQQMRKAIVVMAGDHGVCEEGVSAFPQEVTAQMTLNFLHGGAAVNVLARQAGADVYCADVGIMRKVEHADLLQYNVRRGTRNMVKEAAMSRAEAIEAMTVGLQIVDQLYQDGYRMFATGEMGIGNTTPSAAILAVLAQVPAGEAVGRGTGIDEAKLQHKARVIEKAVQVNKPDPADALDVLAKVGGLEIAGLVGLIIGAAARRCPIVIDGFISSAAALIASRLAPLSVSYMIASHLSEERGHRAMLEAVGLKPILQMNMRLGEGTGSALCFPILDSAVAIVNEMATFASAGISE